MGEVYVLPRLLISRREFHTHLDCSAIFPIIPVIQQGQLLECSIFPAMELAQYQDYSYARLPGNQSIRLFIIQPALMEHPEQIHCSIDTFDLDEQPSCHALSYTWSNTIEAKDDPTGGYCRNRTIWIDSKQLQITQNLYHVLVQIRSVDHCYWWVDMICVNQQERGTQSTGCAVRKDL